MGLKISYKDLSSFEFAQTMQKIGSTPTHGQLASRIHKVVKALDRARKAVRDEYRKEIIETFGKRDDKGALVRPQDNPEGFEPIEEKKDEFLKAHDAFGDRQADLDVKPFTVDMFGDMKISASDLENLGEMYAGNHEPAAAENVKAIR